MALVSCPECSNHISDKAKACPYCGLPSDGFDATESNARCPSSSSIICPDCNSENTQSIKMVVLSGTTSGSSTGIGVNTDLDIGAGKVKSEYQTVLAKQFIPGESPDGSLKGCGCFSFVIGIVLLVVGVASSHEGSGFLAFLGFLGIVVGIIAINGVKKDDPKQKEWEAKVKLYEEGWICHKCGKTWIPSGNNAALTDDSPLSDIEEVNVGDATCKDGKLLDGLRFDSEPTQKRGLHVITGLFVGVCSGTAVVSMLELLLHFNGIVSNTLIAACVLCAVIYSIKNPDDSKYAIVLNTLNVIVFQVVILFSYLYSFMDNNRHPLLSDMPLMFKISNNFGLTLTIGIPGYLSLILLFIIDRRNAKKSEDAPLLNYPIKYRSLATLFIVILMPLLIAKLFFSEEPLTRNEVDKKGYSFVSGETYVNYKSLKKTASGSTTVEVAEVNDFMVNQHLYDINCKDQYITHLDWVSHMDMPKSIMGRLATPMAVQFSSNSDAALTSIISQVCKSNGYTVFHNQSTSYAAQQSAFENQSSVSKAPL